MHAADKNDQHDLRLRKQVLIKQSNQKVQTCCQKADVLNEDNKSV